MDMHLVQNYCLQRVAGGPFSVLKFEIGKKLNSRTFPYWAAGQVFGPQYGTEICEKALLVFIKMKQRIPFDPKVS